MKTLFRILLFPIWIPAWLILGLILWVADSDLTYEEALDKIARDIS